ncbi:MULTISPECIES: sulfate/molybdate ABC transporter ATP-binding protein [unclassified Beijerinckia]|uniref:sulfate/molybdate ABC transporter ATP-binding protein n=1 Tax=unclassified Beijerinckia TaxID=2638183 RepID=UPI00089C501E|nr:MULTISPECIES: sulfate/molybdate ABC transporter ATP-binding protein [unclassified Beijerinckia]MDH7796543.1 sulfate transport system ATP-binding protein [Beijerinckia sp. GAS462]SEC49548.1 sulfate transport system ATP-binding protein [Beijerinckia sp. 28-YEA-48]
MSVSITVENAHKQFTSYPALRDVSLRVEQQELVALLGPSGSGKTTLLRAIAGLEQLDQGQVFFDKTDMRSLSLRERRIGFVFQSYALFKHMTVFENIAFGLRARPRRERPSSADIRKRVGDLLDLVQLSGLEKRFPTQLSGGQRQRVALARALAIEPSVLLLDEPFGALDAKVRKDLRGWLRELHERTGQTTLFVTHDQEEALELADKVAILNQGVIEQIGSPDAVYDSPENAFVCEFLGEANKLPVHVAGGQAFFDDAPIFGGIGQNRSGPASLYVRPQHIKLADNGPLALPGIVERIRRNGAVRRLEVAVRGYAKRLELDLASSVAPAIGERVSMKIVNAHIF